MCRIPRASLALLALLAAGCPVAPTGQGADMAMPPDPPDAATAGDGGQGCSPACGGATRFCNGTKHCVGCLGDGDCSPGEYCKVVSDAVASCVTGCTGDARCANGQKCCNMLCVDTQTDGTNCGACGKSCVGPHATFMCVAGACAGAKCDPGWDDCNIDLVDGCESNLHADPNNCTGCGKKCALANAIADCADGCFVKACTFGYDHCTNNPMDGCETKVSADVKNCGGCNKPCANPPNAMAGCANGACFLASCNAGTANCDGNAGNGCESNVDTDVKNCGMCGNVCPQNAVCKSGGCSCAMCNFPNALAVCVNAICMLDKCVAGFANCNNMANDGCEVDINRDKNNCGQCGTVCPQNMPACVSAQCTLPVDNPDPLVRCQGDVVVKPFVIPQNAKWANSVVAFSSEYTNTMWAASQVLGPPSTYPTYGDAEAAWATLNEDDLNEFITLGYPANSIGSQVWVIENYAGDAVKSITITDANGPKVIYTNVKPKTVGGCAFILMVPTGTNLAITQVRVDLASELVPDWNEIDAVGIVP